jgi:hypothetical protein
MPYVAKFADGTYLIRVANARAYKERRRRTPDLSEATQWTAPGHVKNALVHAAEESVVAVGETVHVVEVSVEERTIRERVRIAGKPYNFRTEKV